MTPTAAATAACLLLASAGSTSAFVVQSQSPSGQQRLPLQQQQLQQQRTAASTTSLFGLFDGVKEAFSAPALERSQIDSERETPIDRWMGWSVDTTDTAAAATEEQAAAFKGDFIDSMDEANYVAVTLPKPMGIIFEENDAEFGGIFVQALKEDGVAAKNGILQAGDQLVAVGTTKVSGMDFDDALGTILDSPEDETKLVLFRGNAKQLYGPTGPSQEWLDKFCAKGGVEVSAS